MDIQIPQIRRVVDCGYFLCSSSIDAVFIPLRRPGFAGEFPQDGRIAAGLRQ